MKYWSAFLLIVGICWLLFDLWLLLTLTGISEPVSVGRVLVYWGGMFTGPITLMVGASILLRGGSPKRGAVLTVAGCLFLTVFALYSSTMGLRRAPLQMPPPYAFYAILLAVMVLADVAAYRISRLLVSMPTIRE